MRSATPDHKSISARYNRLKAEKKLGFGCHLRRPGADVTPKDYGGCSLGPPPGIINTHPGADSPSLLCCSECGPGARSPRLACSGG